MRPAWSGVAPRRARRRDRVRQGRRRGQRPGSDARRATLAGPARRPGPGDVDPGRGRGRATRPVTGTTNDTTRVTFRRATDADHDASVTSGSTRGARRSTSRRAIPTTTSGAGWPTEMAPSHEVWVAVDDDGPGRRDSSPCRRPRSTSCTSARTVHRSGHRSTDSSTWPRADRPAGLELCCFQVNGRARRFYERNGFAAVGFGDGASNEERPAGHPLRLATRVVTRHRARPRHVGRRDADRRLPLRATRPGRRSCSSTARRPTTRRSASSARPRRPVRPVRLDRRGRGASGDTLPYAIEREYEDVAAVAEAVVAQQRGTAASTRSATRTAAAACWAPALETAASGGSSRTRARRRAPGTRYGDAGPGRGAGRPRRGRPDRGAARDVPAPRRRHVRRGHRPPTAPIRSGRCGSRRRRPSPAS